MKNYEKDIEKVLVSPEEIQGAVKRICREMENDFKDSEKPVLLMGILKGSVVFMADINILLPISSVIALPSPREQLWWADQRIWQSF